MKTKTKTQTLIDKILDSIEKTMSGDKKLTHGALSSIRNDMIEIDNRLGSMQQRMAYMERDQRESWRATQVLITAGALTEEEVSEATTVVYSARGPKNEFTDVESILDDFDQVFKIGD